MKLHLLLAPLMLCLVSCEKKQTIEVKQRLVENGILDNSLAYSAEEVGWKASIPHEWKLMTPGEKAKLGGAGKKEMEKITGGPIDTSQLRDLINLTKDKFNSFLSTIEPFNEATDGPYAEKQKELNKLLLDTYKNAGVKLGKVATGKETVDGLEFLTWEIEVLHPSKNAVIMTQKMYSRLINGYDFGMTMSTNNEKDRQVLSAIVTSSKFSKQN